MDEKDKNIPLIGIDKVIVGLGTSCALGNKFVLFESLDKDIDMPTDISHGYANSGKDNPIKFLFCMMLLCTKGKISLKMNLDTIEIKPGEIFLSAPGVILSRVDVLPGTRAAGIAFDPKAFVFMGNPNNRSYTTIRNAFLTNFVISAEGREPDKMVGLFKEMEKIVSTEHFQFKEECIEGMLQCVCTGVAQWLVDSGKSSSEGRTRGERMMIDFMKLLQENCMKEREIKFYADKFCLTPKYFAKLIYDQSGRHANQWIRDFVILEAKAMLRTGRYTVQQVSYNMNFPNSSFFGKYFKAATGVSPRHYMLEGEPEK
jgi:AraC-like DNA-binding protein